MVTSGMDKKLKVYDIRAYRPLQSYFLPAGASCLSLSQRGLLSAATGDIVQVIIAAYNFAYVFVPCLLYFAVVFLTLLFHSSIPASHGNTSELY